MSDIPKPLVSCLMVTQEGRLSSSKRAVTQYAAQSWSNKEIIVVCDGSKKYNTILKKELLQIHENIKFVFLEKKYLLGQLRNISVQEANGEIVCQWDDDDQYHHKRIELQLQKMLKEKTDFSFLTDQLHYFEDSNELFWVDWKRDSEGHFHSFSPSIVAIPGTLMARKKCMPPYVNVKLGEDSYLIDDISPEYNISLLEGIGWVYLYVYHGQNSFDRKHHSEIAGIHRKFIRKIELSKWLSNKNSFFSTVSEFMAELQDYDLSTGVTYTFM